MRHTRSERIWEFQYSNEAEELLVTWSGDRVPHGVPPSLTEVEFGALPTGVVLESRAANADVVATAGWPLQARGAAPSRLALPRDKRRNWVMWLPETEDVIVANYSGLTHGYILAGLAYASLLAREHRCTVGAKKRGKVEPNAPANG